MVNSPTSPGRSRVLSWLLRALALFLVPVVLFTTPQTAQAVTRVGPVIDASWSVDVTGGGDYKCAGNGYWWVVDGTPHIKTNWTCDKGFMAPVDTVRIYADGDTCNFQGTTHTFPDGSSFSETMDLTPLTAPLYDRDTCVVTSGSAFVCDDKWVGPTECDSIPFTWSLGQPSGDPEFTCTDNTVDAPVLSARYQSTDGLNRPMRNVTFNWTQQPLTNQTWHVYMIVSEAGAQYATTISGTSYRRNSGSTSDLVLPTTMPRVVSQRTGANGTTTETSTIVGFGYAKWNGQSTAMTNLATSATSAGQLGRSNPAACEFYWGTQIYTDAASTFDTPLGPVTPADDPDPAPGAPPSDPDDSDESSGCGFDWTDPGTYASAGICKLVGLMGRAVDLLGQIVDAFGGLAGAIGSAIADAFAGVMDLLSDALSALFVPDPGYFDGKVSSVRADLEDTSPSLYVSSFTAQDWSGLGGSGCSGIPVEWSMEGQTYGFDLGAACSGSMATAANTVRTVATVSLFVFGALACIRILGASVGWYPSFGRGGGEHP